MAEYSDGYGKGYSKRPLWQWILIYLVIGGIVYYLVYYFLLRPKGANYFTPSAPTNYTVPGY